MNIKKAELLDAETILKISELTISEIYPCYYPMGAVDFFLKHHSKDNIVNDIKNNAVYFCIDDNSCVVGTVTIKNNEICRLFVLPQYQGKGYGRELLNFSENKILKLYSEIYLDASLPAKSIYIKRGYKGIDYKSIKTENGDFLCYDIMVKQK